MGTSQADKVASHERIIDAAATLIRRDGLGSLSVSSLMSNAGLTHGGFYRHFASRDALITQAVDGALERSASSYGIAKPGVRSTPARSLGEIIDKYLSPTHRDDPGSGCAIAALATDVARGTEDARTAYTHHVRGYLDRLSAALEGSDGADDDPYLTLAAMVGSVVLARAVNDPTLSDDLLFHTAHGLRRIARS
jgi:TetR/AcrR family transcriptional regulator, transcriptional repressor for nem operon